ncbi:chemotaxis protein CheW [Planctomicrobium sp. SH664]|uniref:chemotaxis protein CheW n=1 Tax=Planctomicrobium sp. SH664 TaxID=3448125 RepID=UPI003F5ADE91
MEELDDIVKEFLVESYENLDRLDRDLVALESTPCDRERLSSVFRTIHTIKGTSGFLAYPKLEHVAHVGENLLVPLRDGGLRLNAEIAGGLLSMVDAIRDILANIETSGGEGDADYNSLIATLEDLRNPPSTRAEVNETIRTADGNGAHTSSRLSEPLPDTLTAPAPGPRPVVEPVHVNDSTPDIEPETAERTASITDSTVRIDVQLLDRLMNLVGELVLARNQILQFSRTSEDSTIAAASQRLNHITTELQAGVMKTRMQPISNAWSKLPRVIRDLSNSCGKRVQIKLEGAETELDKTILEAIKDPLTHIVRNSVDHGIESPEVRESRGKPAEGTLCLRAFHEGGQVNIEISDDGGGIDVQRVRSKAVSQRLITAEQADAMSERELIQLILLPGFSTADKVTNVSGRGVGMDVVKTNVEKIGGTLDISSVLHQGTTLRIRIPLTLAIVPALIVACRSERYAIPQVSLLELVRLEGERSRRDIELIHDSPVYRLRGKLLPLVYLDEQLGLRERRTVAEHRAGEAVNIIVLQAEDHQFGLIVDHIRDTQEIVVKPLGPHLKSLSAYAGATIMGDGTVSLILDVSGLAQQANILVAHRDATLAELNSSMPERVETRQSWLVVDPGDGTRAAIPLASVSRLEEIDVHSIEYDSRQEVVQYRGRIMPLVRLAATHDRTSRSNTAKLPVVVFSDLTHSVGLMVQSVVDIVECAALSQGTLNTQIIAGKVTRLIDPQTFLADLKGPHYSTASSATVSAATAARSRQGVN